MFFKSTEDEKKFRQYKKIYNKIKKAIEINQTSELTESNFTSIMNQANIDYHFAENQHSEKADKPNVVAEHLIIDGSDLEFDSILRYDRVIDIYHNVFVETRNDDDFDTDKLLKVYQKVLSLYSQGEVQTDSLFDYNKLFVLNTPESNELAQVVPQPLTMDWVLTQIEESMAALKLNRRQIHEIEERYNVSDV